MDGGRRGEPHSRGGARALTGRRATRRLTFLQFSPMPLQEFDAIPPRDLAPGFHARLVHSERMTIARVDVDAGAELPEHAHPHEQVTTLLSGDFELTVGGEVHRLRAGSIVVIPGGVRHSARALTTCRVLDVFQPVREDYR
jgi:quercetin dioxygenase-like cupin family protein